MIAKAVVLAAALLAGCATLKEPRTVHRILRCTCLGHGSDAE